MQVRRAHLPPLSERARGRGCRVHAHHHDGDAVRMCVRPWFLLLLEPWTHYLPVDYHLGDLTGRIAWAVDPARQPAVQRMVGRMHEYAEAVLTTRGMLDYAAEVLRRYAGSMTMDSEEAVAARPDAMPAADYLERYGHLERIPEEPATGP